MKGFDTSVFAQPKADLIKKIFFTFLSVILTGFGIAFNAKVGLGSDPISAFSYGIHSFFKISLGAAFNVTNYILLFIVLIFGRRYINIGTLIHAIFLGIFVNLGEKFYLFFNLNVINNIFFRASMVVIGFFLLFFGTALLIVTNVGVDVWTGLALLLRDKMHKEYKFFRVAIDIFSVAFCFLLGGIASIGVPTALAAIFGGPLIQNFAKFIKKSIFSRINLKNKTF